MLLQPDEDKGKGSSTSTKCISERLEEEVGKAHETNVSSSDWMHQIFMQVTLAKNCRLQLTFKLAKSMACYSFPPVSDTCVESCNKIIDRVT